MVRALNVEIMILVLSQENMSIITIIFKLESKGHSLVALCSKTCSLKTEVGDKLSCKGINKNLVFGLMLSEFKEKMQKF